MAENSKIEWTDHTFNSWVGCTKVSPACDHCYAESWAKRAGSPELWEGKRRRTTEANWRKPIKWNAEAGKLGIRHKVFCCSLADVFDNEVPDEWRHDLFRLIRATQNLDWLLLTKRIGNVKKMHPGGDYPNIWLGATVINQEEADRDIPKLLDAPAAVRFLSIEPMLGPVRLSYLVNGTVGYQEGYGVPHGEPWFVDGDGTHWSAYDATLKGVDWIICGGESGPSARHMDHEWARSLRDQCQAVGVPFFLKQMMVGGRIVKEPELDGRQWLEFPPAPRSPGEGGEARNG